MADNLRHDVIQRAAADAPFIQGEMTAFRAGGVEALREMMQAGYSLKHIASYFALSCPHLVARMNCRCQRTLSANELAGICLSLFCPEDMLPIDPDLTLVC